MAKQLTVEQLGDRAEALELSDLLHLAKVIAGMISERQASAQLELEQAQEKLELIRKGGVD